MKKLFHVLYKIYVGNLARVRMIYQDYGGHCGFYTQPTYIDLYNYMVS
jgi:hypothetical protein